MTEKSVAIIIIRNSKGQYFLNKRLSTKKIFPSLYALGAGGKIDPGETPENAAKRELFEETKIQEPIRYLGEFLYSDSSVTQRVYSYAVVTEQEISNYDREWEWSGWVNEDQVLELLDSKSICPDTEVAFSLLISATTNKSLTLKQSF
ncbi:MAG: NUDIX domain-containing protein [bacterium]|nr:NUDIX domain-containing protein [bacterium]